MARRLPVKTNQAGVSPQAEKYILSMHPLLKQIQHGSQSAEPIYGFVRLVVTQLAEKFCAPPVPVSVPW